MNSEQMGTVAYDHNAAHPVGAGNDRNAAGLLFGVAALGLGNDGALRNAQAHQILAAHGTFRVLIAASPAQGNNDWRNATVEKYIGVVQARTEDWGGPAIVLRSTENADRVRRRSLLQPGKVFNLYVDPAEPAQSAEKQGQKKQQKQAESPVLMLRLGRTLHDY